MGEPSYDDEDTEELGSFNRFVSRIINNITKEMPEDKGDGVHSLNVRMEKSPSDSPSDRDPTVPEEPLVDVIQERDFVRVVTEMRGAQRSEIVLLARPNELNISLMNSKASYCRTVDMPCLVDVEGSYATFRNGILEVFMKRSLPCEPRRIEVK